MTPVPPPPAPDACASGFVWREADATDHVCVTPDSRSLVASENAVAVDRRSPNGGDYGPDTCVQGYVWREADQTDHVCVVPGRRDDVTAENQLAAQRRAV